MSILSNIPSIIVAVLGIGALITWHELGHFWAARLFGMRVLRFSIGFGPAIWSRVKNGVEYQIGAIPFGGFVQIMGMSPLEEGFDNQEDAYFSKPRWQRFLVMFAGPLFNYALAVPLFFVVLWAPSQDPGVLLTSIRPESPAAVATLKAGDAVTHIDGKLVKSETDVIEAIQASGGKPMAFSVERANNVEAADKDGAALTYDKLNLTVTAAQSNPEAPFRIGSGLMPRGTDFGEALTRSLKQPISSSVQLLTMLSNKLTKKDDSVKVGSVVAITSQLSAAAKKSLRDLLWMLASLSVSLGLFNLLPVPALDGIKMLFLTIEGIMRRDINQNAQLWVNGLGLLMILGLMAVLTVFDTIDLVGG